ncbi:MAG: hypothetical protein ABSF33_01690 [Acidimicrobiales bacterium]
MLDPLEEQDTVGQAREGVMDSPLMRSGGRLLEISPTLCIHQVGGRHIGQGLGRAHFFDTQPTRCVPIEVERTQPIWTLSKRKGEHGGQAQRDCLRCEYSVTVIRPEVGHDHCPVGYEGADTWTLAELTLQLFEFQR